MNTYKNFMPVHQITFETQHLKKKQERFSANERLGKEMDNLAVP